MILILRAGFGTSLPYAPEHSPDSQAVLSLDLLRLTIQWSAAAALAQAIEKRDPRSTWVLFTSANAVRTFEALADRIGGAAGLSHLRDQLPVVAIGTRTAQALEGWRTRQRVVATDPTPASLVQSLKEASVLEVIWPNNMTRRREIPAALSEAGIRVTEIPTYGEEIDPQTVEFLHRSLATGGVSGIGFTSANVVGTFFDLLDSWEPSLRKILENVPLGGIGPLTATVLQTRAHREVLTASETSVDSLVRALRDALSR